MSRQRRPGAGTSDGAAGSAPVRQAGGRTILELWVPAEELPEFNRHIVGPIRLTHTFTPEP